ncbi:D-lactate dehydrogenase [Eremomyces bilateralis CBS 781.70]|uniref:D-lactate dehydrogenase n=1 Tax=Eremomyces bilateralis CBS 781.70 TaxID=1392243 RepID=A0A6G1GBJ4_9PEZI|nr:D-lactate dehydrogenase [Eremomyces bilateralis CBS 781.70]KAF1815271.1 D-lactate dehydrogenase [Eremomyces bilateralis CBS 781.70]
MKLAVFSTQPYDRTYLTQAIEAHNTSNPPTPLEPHFHALPLSPATTHLAAACPAICVFVNDDVSAPILTALHAAGVRLILLRCAGFNNVDIPTATALGVRVARMSAYSPESVAEFALALTLTLNRKTHRAFNRVREGNFALAGLEGFRMYGATVGLLGTGKIGLCAARIFKGFGCRVLGYDLFPTERFTELGGEYASLEEVLRVSDIVSLHCPLIDAGTRHIINAETLAMMKPGAMLVNTSRGGLIDTAAVITALKKKTLGSLAMDVYEMESSLFYVDHSGEILDDDVFGRLMTFPNVLICGHQAFFTKEALQEIADGTCQNFQDWVVGTKSPNVVVEGRAFGS